MPHSQHIPFYFVLDQLISLKPRIRPMFGCHAVYIGEQIMFILRDRKTHPEVNGVWIATEHKYHKSLRKELPSLCSVSVLNNGKGETGWQMIQVEADDFETSVMHACELVLHGDARIGKTPKPKKKKKKA